MNKISLKKFVSLILIAAMIMIAAAGCGKVNAIVDESAENTSVQSVGEKAFTFIVVDKEGNETSFDIKSDRETVGEALQDEGLIEGTAGEYGLYVTKVNGIEAIYENDKTYWSFYVNGEYAMTGVDTTPVEDGATYAFKVEGE